MVYGTQAFRPSSRTHSPDYELQRGSRAATRRRLCATPHANLKQLKGSSGNETIWDYSSHTYVNLLVQDSSNQAETYRSILVIVAHLCCTGDFTPYRRLKRNQSCLSCPPLISVPAVHTEAYLHVVSLTGELSGSPGEQGRTGLV